jgi:hypothetical protein
MNLTIPAILVYVFAACICYRFMGLRVWHLLAFLLLLVILLAATSAPEIQTFLTTLLHGGHQ